MFEPKIATCCHCGRRTLLQKTANGGHELACASCGAPIHVMKPLRPRQAEAAASHAPVRQPAKVGGKTRTPKGKKSKRRRPFWRKVVSEIWDEVEDLFD